MLMAMNQRLDAMAQFAIEQLRIVEGWGENDELESLTVHSIVLEEEDEILSEQKLEKIM